MSSCSFAQIESQLSMQKSLPTARTEKLIVKELPDEVLVYDLDSNKAHCLNHTAALVWRACDGKTSIEELSSHLSRRTGVAVDERIVWLTLKELETINLLDKPTNKPAFVENLSRRQLIRNLGVAAVMLPAIISLAAPTAQAQASCVPPGVVPGGCNAATNCCSGSCRNPAQCT